MNYILPESDENGWVQTLNDRGYMSTQFDPFTVEFLNFCESSPNLRVFEGGAAYGNASLAALKAGANVTANDSEERHLEILKDRAGSLEEKLTLLAGTLPHDIDCLPNSFDAILCSRMLHFLTGKELEKCINHFFNWLKPGGKAFLIAETPYLKCYSAFIPVYEERKKNNMAWPGLLEDSTPFASIRYNNIPSLLHFLDPDLLSTVCHKAGFIIEKSHFIDRQDFPDELKFDGRESVGIIAVKP